MKKNFRSLLALIACVVVCLFFAACVPPVNNETAQESLAPQPASGEKQDKSAEAGQLPVRFQKPSYLLGSKATRELGVGNAAGISIPIGADITSSAGPVALRDIMKRLAALKGMNISWASDVDQMAMVDVDIRAEDDFFKSLDNILRQKDYFHEVQGNTIVINYRETRKFHVAMPFLKSSYKTAVGGDVLGAGGVAGQSSAGTLMGTIKLENDDNKFDVWGNISKNLDQLLGIWEETVVLPTPASAGNTPATPAATPPATTTKRNVQAGKGYYTIDKPIGLITVTAPKPLVDKIAVYLDNLKKELYRQVTIEAKVVEVIINDTEKKGIDWSALLDFSVNMEMFGPNGIIYQQRSLPQVLRTITDEVETVLTTMPGEDSGTTTTTTTTTSSSDTTNNSGRRMVSKLALPGSPFGILVSALETQGPTNILANPKISVLNGQPALISVGENVRFIEKVETTISAGASTSAISTSVTTNSVMSGLGMSVVANIIDNDEIILSMTPVTSSLTKMEERSFGAGMIVQLPTVNLREMSTVVRIKNGDVLMVGGLIDNVESDTVKKVPLLGDIPGVNRLFSHSNKTTRKKELVIMLQPRIH